MGWSNAPSPGLRFRFDLRPVRELAASHRAGRVAWPRFDDRVCGGVAGSGPEREDPDYGSVWDAACG